MSEEKMALLEQENENLKADSKKKDELISKLTSELSKPAGSVSINQAPAVSLPADPVEINKKKYVFAKPRFILDGKEYLSEEAVLDTKLCEAIVKVPGQKILKEYFSKK